MTEFLVHMNHFTGSLPDGGMRAMQGLELLNPRSTCTTTSSQGQRRNKPVPLVELPYATLAHKQPFPCQHIALELCVTSTSLR
eukprot:4674692-Amphidinium_carterae.1